MSKTWEVKLEVGAAILTQEVVADAWEGGPEGVVFVTDDDAERTEVAFYPMLRLVSLRLAPKVTP